MIKVRYNEKTGQLLKRYPASIEVPQPFIEITEAAANSLHDLPKQQSWFYENGKFVIKNNSTYLAESKLNALREKYSTFSKAWQYQFDPLRQAVEKESASGATTEELIQLITDFILPAELEAQNIKQQFISLLQGE